MFYQNLLKLQFINLHHYTLCRKIMCVTFFCLQPKIDQKNDIEFLIGFNRDQNTQRETDPLGPFVQDPNIYAGRDKISSGTWLGVNIKTGIMVILTNFDLNVKRYGKSRGKLVHSFLKTQSFEKTPLQEYNKHIKSRLCQVLKERQQYSAFNLLVYSIRTETIFYICSQMDLNEPKVLQKGQSHGMCNGPLDELWEKTEHGLRKFRKVINCMSKQEDPKKYFFDETFKLLKDNVSFDSNLESQASVFINPYYSFIEKAQRMTKCSFCCVIKKNHKTNEFEIEMKEITYKSPKLQQTIVEYRKKIGIDWQNQKD